jgi:hypothetical protein
MIACLFHIDENFVLPWIITKLFSTSQFKTTDDHEEEQMGYNENVSSSQKKL